MPDPITPTVWVASAAATLLLRAPRAGRQVVEANEIHVAPTSVFRDLQQIVDAVEPGLARKVVRDALHRNPIDRIDDDAAILHRVSAADFDARALPDANGAPDAPALDARPKRLREQHRRVLRY